MIARPAAWLTPRWIVLSLLVMNFVWAVIVPAGLTQPPSIPLAAAFVAGLTAFGVVLMMVINTVANPAPPRRPTGWLTGLLILIPFILWLPMYSWAETGESPWAWLAAFAIAAIALTSWRMGIVAAVALGTGVVAGGVSFRVEFVPDFVLMLGCALVVWLLSEAFVWLHKLLETAQASRDAQGELGIAAERLRASRELHDVLGHRLSIIALKAELAAGLATTDPARSVAENNEIRELAQATHREARRAIHGETVADFSTQVRAASLVLSSAGIETKVDLGDEVAGKMDQTLSHLLATVIREAVTNILRHSDARRVSITVANHSSSIVLDVVNDGVRESDGQHDASTHGTGLASLSARCRAAGARLFAGNDTEGCFTLRVEHPSDARGPA